ncbi:hypothetical protein [Paenibacillus assamensis]|uniref:hypothetical protein n=1 Tax=Paenibacillus assamensis TaxID=311244 RepID=UPI0003F8E0CF|nr:hypothetical protein [Paenibacillus assamensis]
MQNNIEGIRSNYAIGQIESYRSINKGSISDAYHIVSEQREWVLRRLKNRVQGINEYIIAAMLENDHICPRMMTNKSDLGYS